MRDVPIPPGAISLTVALMPASAAAADRADAAPHGFVYGGFELEGSRGAEAALAIGMPPWQAPSPVTRRPTALRP